MPDAEALIQLPSSMEGMVIHSQIVTNLDTQELSSLFRTAYMHGYGGLLYDILAPGRRAQP